MKLTYKTTIFSCFGGYVVQAVVNNFVPLLFITLETSYHIPLSQITMLVTANFGIQLIVDILSAVFVDKIGYRVSIVIAHIFAALGLMLLTILPGLFADPFIGIFIAVAIYAIGGGLIEVLISPIMQSCPTDNKEKAMSLLHSFYCWGQVCVVLLSTIFFQFAGIGSWKLLALLWAMLPIINGILFLRTPIAPLLHEGESVLSFQELFRNKMFWILMLMMLCAGASEQSVSQWASAFAEIGLGISKTAGDLAGPMAFALLMGSARAFYGKYGERIHLNKFMLGSGVLCVLSYLGICLFPSPTASLISCAVCGLSVGIMWPGTFSKAAAAIRAGGTAMFALLALAGDLGCSAGPSVVGFVSSAVNDNMKAGILAAAVFPLLLVICLFLSQRSRNVPQGI